MTSPLANADWVPDHQLHVIATLAHVDGAIQRIGDLLFDYQVNVGPLEFEEVANGSQVEVRVSAVQPLPAAISRLAADAMTQLRAALEHTLFAEAEHLDGRALSDKEAIAMEMPVKTAADDLLKWPTQGARRTVDSIQPHCTLWNRIESLQPFNRRSPQDHPLKVLANHTNQAKHREPTVAATRLVGVRAENGDPTLKVPPRRAQAVAPGDVIATASIGDVIPIAIYPSVGILRPGSERWEVLMHELRDLEAWVRTVAIPVLILGTRDAVAKWSPALNINHGIDDLREAVRGTSTPAAAERLEFQLMAATARQGLVDVIGASQNAPTASQINRWASQLDDAHIMNVMDNLTPGANDGDPRKLAAYVENLKAQIVSNADPAGALD